MLTVHHGNRLETLAGGLARLFRFAGGEPLRQEVVVVPNAGMARWLAFELARHLGVCAAVRFVTPRAYFGELLRAVLPDPEAAAPFEPAALSWRLYTALGKLDPGEDLAPLVRYLAAGGPPQRWQLATVLASTFDRYLLYRPRTVLRWEEGENAGDWQARLWRRVVAEAGDGHRARSASRLVEALYSGEIVPGLPSRLAVFGLPTMAPADVDLLGAIASRVPVDLFLLNPCAEYAGDIRSRKVIARLAACDEAEAASFTEGNPLLASCGRQPLALLDRLLALDPTLVEYSSPPAEATLLGAVQADIFRLRSRGGAEEARTPIRPDDRSIMFHVCHSPMREAEVLYDHLLDLFATDPTLEPGQVIVMAPDVATYARCLEAVCAAQPQERRLRITVADLGVRAEHPLVEAFLGLLQLPTSRLEVDRVFRLLELDAVRRRFGLGDEDLERARSWLRDAGVCWGADAASRKVLGLPAAAEHTWRFGLDRLVLGYAMDTEAATGALVPVEGVEGSEARSLGGLVAFGEAVMGLQRELADPRTPAAWTVLLGKVLDRFCDPGPEDQDAALAVREALAALAEDAARGGAAEEPVPLEVVREALTAALESRATGGTFLSGGVTVCAPVPMRSIPFAVVCLLGMDVGSFPRVDRLPGFDLLAHERRPGDPSRREDDRTLFLEAILSARRRLYISWTGRSIRDDTEIPPSVLVSELLDYVEQGFAPPPGSESVRTHLVVEHRLQAFSATYFAPATAREGRLFSYAGELCAALRERACNPRRSRPLVEARLPEADRARRSLRLEDLADAVENPARTLLRERLGIRLLAEPELPNPREPLVVEGLDRHRLREAALAGLLRGWNGDRIKRVLRGRGMLPHGVAGDVVAERAIRAAEPIARAVTAALPFTTTITIDWRSGDFAVTGTIDRLGPGGRVVHRPGAIRPGDRLRLWVRHLALQVSAPDGIRPASRLIGWDDRKQATESLVLDPVPRRDAEMLLASLLDVYWESLHRLVPLFPQAGYAYVTAKSDDTGLRGARRAYEGSDYSPGDRHDRWVAHAWRGVDPIGAEFAAAVRALWKPLLAAEGGR